MYQVGTLTEIMIAAFLSLLVMAASLKTYLNLHQVLLKQQAMQIEQQNALAVINLIKDEIDKAGMRGCYSTDADAIKVANNELSVSYQAYPSVNIAANSTRERIIVDKLLHFAKQQTLMISDCEHAEILSIVDLHIKNGKQIIIPAQALKYSYRSYAEISWFVTHRYYLANSGQLMRIDGGGHQQTIAKGIYELQFQQDTKGIYFQFATRYRDQFTKWVGYAAKKTA